MSCCNLCFLTLSLTFVFNHGVTCESAEDVKSLMTQLFSTEGYNKFVRPSNDQSVPLHLYINLYLVSLTDIDEVKEKMTSTAYLELIWEDWYLSWTPADYNGIQYLYIPQSEVWKPDIALENGYSKMKELGDNFILTKVTYEGDVNWYPYEVFETKCSIDISYFPFDEQTCQLRFGVWMSVVQDIYVHMGSKGILLDDYQENEEWQIIKTSSEASIDSDNETLVSYSIHVKRKPDYYLHNIVLPVLLLSILAVFTFVIPVESGEKMGFCMTMFLAFAVFLTIVSAQLPVSSTLSLLSKYLIFLVVLGTLIIMATAVELRINYRSTESFPIPKWLGCLVKVSRIIMCRRPCRTLGKQRLTIQPQQTRDCKSPVKDSKQLGSDCLEQPPTTDTDESIQWTDVVSALDFYLFWVFLTTELLETVILLANGYVQSIK
ncbi:neuronal acetylcholine receptor subunit alpha-6-like [Argopecten irradians]|uniref:neuronal acetylcholine receptor subunit alpha-6-like n=1 Tax=Argopecten irradians TaxID=31199 RepID=UPI00371F603B